MPAKPAPSAGARVGATPRVRPTKLTPIKAYLFAYNVVSCLAWAHIFYLTLSSVLSPRPHAAPSFLSSLFGSSSPTGTSSSLVSAAVDRLRGAYVHKHLGWWIKYTQSAAVLEVVHAALGWVRSPLGTTGAQVFSRLYAVWGVVEPVPETHNHPLFTTMLFAWSVTEVIRYAFYAMSLLGIDVYALNWLRYTTFLPLYPLGAGSEAFLAFSTLPPLSTLPFVPRALADFHPLAWAVARLPPGFYAALRHSALVPDKLLWHAARQGARRAPAARPWTALDLARLGLFFVWWPALYVLYTHMLRQRRKFFSTKTVGGVNKAR
ncbi:hypothetical protein Q5752_000510 [Cryptotrichosporon argae]